MLFGIRLAIIFGTTQESRFLICFLLMMLRHFRQILLVLGLIVVGPGVTQALTVQEVGISPGQFVNITTTIYPAVGAPYIWTGNVLAGVNQLKVGTEAGTNFVAMNGFCIDPFHFARSSSTGYSYASLTTAPKPPGGPLTTLQVTLIERLWGSYYTAALGNASTAAGLQIAIWNVVGAALGFHVNGANDYGAAGFLAAVSAVNYSGPRTHLIALTGPGQDYVVAAPDAGATVGLLGLAFLSVFIARWWSMRRQVPALGSLSRAEAARRRKG
jgi:hypothetical protein